MKHLFLGASVAAVLAFGPAAWAQTADATTSQTSVTTNVTAPADPALAVADTVIVPVVPQLEMALPADTPLAVKFNLPNAKTIEGIDPKLTDGVTFEGYARKVEVPLTNGTSKIGQVLVTSVSRGDRSEVIDAQGLSSQFQAEESDSLFPDKTVDVSGSRPALIAALQRLMDQPTEEEEKTKVEADNGTTGNDGADGTGGGASNPDAAAYQSPDTTGASVGKADPVQGVTLTTEGCDIRVDLEQGIAIQQNRTETTEDGVVTDAGTCADGDKRYPLTRNYSACTDAIDLTALTATPQYQLYYTDGGGGTNMVGDCQPDTEAATAIVEDTNACPVSVDLTAGAEKAIIQAALVYTNRSGAIVQVRGCEASANVVPVDMVQDVDACSLRHDFDKRQSEELGAWTYEQGGLIYQATRCLPTGRAFPHTTVTSANGAYICTPIVANGMVTIQGREQITVDGVSQYISDCAPVDSAQQALQSTTDGCNNIATWTHDIAGGISYGQERFYFLRPDGQREYVTECQTSAVTYTHSHTQAGWQNHDEALYAYPLTTVSILVGGIDQSIAISQLLPGTPQMVYLDAGTLTQGTGSYTYEGCTKYETTNSVKAWSRPDGSTYSKPIGPGASKPVGDACTYSRPTSSADWKNLTSPNGAYVHPTTICNYEATRSVIRDGTLISQETARRQSGAFEQCTKVVGSWEGNEDRYECVGVCRTPSSQGIAGWLLELGW